MREKVSEIYRRRGCSEKRQRELFETLPRARLFRDARETLELFPRTPFLLPAIPARKGALELFDFTRVTSCLTRRCVTPRASAVSSAVANLALIFTAWLIAFDYTSALPSLKAIGELV
jgi:hypothetical protein